MVLKNFTLFVSTLLIFSFALQSCNMGKQKKTEDIDIEALVSEDEIFEDIDQAKKIFYSLPSPLETAMLIKSAGAEYDEELLNDVDKAGNYNTSRSMALNLGIYTTDLSFASLFDQTQTSITYMSAARTMAEGLDISDAIDNSTIKELEENLENRDVIMDIISETFFNSSSYLKENEREDIATIVLVGGWIEGLYISTQLVGDKPIEDNPLVDRILEQKLSFNILMRLLEQNKTKPTGEVNQEIMNIIADLVDLKNAFDNVSVETSEATTETSADSSITTIKSSTKVDVSPEDFETLTETVKNLRTSFIQ